MDTHGNYGFPAQSRVYGQAAFYVVFSMVKSGIIHLECYGPMLVNSRYLPLPERPKKKVLPSPRAHMSTSRFKLSDWSLLSALLSGTGMRMLDVTRQSVEDRQRMNGLMSRITTTEVSASDVCRRTG